MFDDDDQTTRKPLFTPPDLSDFSVEELQKYKATLQQEITRVDQDIDKKSNYAQQLDGFFKS